MKLRILLFAFLSVFLFNNTQAQCLEITSIFVNSCGNPEGENEMFTFQVGANALPVNDIAVDWPSNSFLGWCQNAGTATSTATLNSTITNGCGILLEPTVGVLPANANVIVITSTNFNTSFNSFSNLADTMYIIYQCAGNTGGHFSNTANVTAMWPLGTRDLIVNVTGTCFSSDTATYDNSINDLNGETALFDAAGNLSYTNNGCNAPVIALSANWSFTDRICNDFGIVNLSTLLSGNGTPGGTWSGPRVTGSNYNPIGYTGLDSITYAIVGTGSCTANIDSTIVFNVVQEQTGTFSTESCDSVFFNGAWFNANTTFVDTTFGSGYACDSFTNVTITINSAITDSSYLAACDSVVFNGTSYFNDIIIRDTITGGGGSTVIDTILQTGFEDSEGWIDHSTGNWTQIDAFGTWTANDMYANQFNPNNGIRNVGMNTVGDYLELPPVSNPQTMYYYDRLSAGPNNLNELTIEYFDGTNWQAISSDSCGHTNYQLVTVDLTSVSALTNVSLRFFRSADDRSAYIDDIVIVGSTSGAGSSCDSIIVTNININNSVQNTVNLTSCSVGDTGTVSTTFTSSLGCDSIYTVITTLDASQSILQNTTLCDGDSAFLAGAFQTTPGSYYDTIPGGGTGPSVLDTFYIETFDGPLTWTLNTPTGANGADNNFWVINNNESGLPAGSCGAVGGNNSLHITSVFFPNGGAAYDAGGLCGLLFCPLTNQAASSGAISTLGRNTLSLEFDFIAGGDALIDNASVLYSIDGGATYLPLTASIKSSTCPGGQGLWQHYAAALPANAENIADLRVRINWTNNDDGIGTDPSVAINDVFITSASPASAACDTIVETQLSFFPPATTIPINLTACDSVVYNGTTYLASTNFTDTITSSNNCDSIYNQVTIVVNQTVTTQNPANPIVICSVNDSTQLPDGTFVNTAGTYPVVFTGGSASGCDSTYVTVVQTQNCDFTCSFDTILYDSFEYDSVIPGLVPGTVIHMMPRGTTAPFIGLSRTGTRYAYFNFQGTPGNVVYTREIEVCPGSDFRYSFWHRQFGNNTGSNVTINMYDGTSNTAPLLNTFNFLSNGTTYNQVISAVMTASTGTVFFELIDNVGGPVVGNDLLFEDFVVEGCLPDTLALPSQNYCNNATTDDLYNYVNTYVSTNGTWNGPSTLANGHLGTFDPASNAFGTYYYTVPGLTNCSDTTVSITLSSLSGQVDTTTITACDSTLFNGTWYMASTSIRDTLIGGASNGCDSIFQTDILINPSAIVINPGNPFTICAANDSVLLPGGAFATTAGTYTFTFAGGAANGCDSTVVTEVLTEICNCFIDLGPDTSLCQGESIVLDAGPGFDTYTWQDNSTNQTLTASTTGTYHCTVTFLDSTNNLVTNGDFEQGNTGFTTDYGPGVGGAFGLLTNPGTYAINTSPSNVHNNFFSCVDHTTGTGNLMIVNGSNVPNTNVWCQNVTVTPNTDYLFSAWAISLENTNAANVATLNFLINGSQFGNSFSPSLTACDWQQFSTTWNSGANINIQICIESDVIAGNNDYGIDDIFFTPFCNFTDSIDVTVNPLPTPDLGADVTICQGSDTLLDATTPNATYLWQDGTTTTPTFTAQNAGVYAVDVTVNGCTGSDTITVSTTPVFNQTTNLSICAGDSAFLENAWQTQAGVYTDNFTTTSNCDSVLVTTLSVIDVVTINETISVCANELPVLINGNLESIAGTYIDTISSSLACDSIINVTVLEINPLPMVTLGADTSTDEGNTISINVIGSNIGDTYTWVNDLGESFTGSSIQANAFQTSEYILTATNQFNCSETDSIIVVVNPIQQTLLQIPTAFSPNGDEINEVFRIANYEDFESYILRIYNRWGELIFDNEGYNVSWNGTYKDVPQNIGSYVYYIQAKPMNGGEEITRSGNVTLIK